MSMLAETVDVVIGVDTHKHTHSAAVVAAATGAAVEDLTVPSDAGGYGRLVELAERHRGLRVWAIEGTGSYGAGLARYLADAGEVVVEVDRPQRPARRNGAKSDTLDAVRAAREALTREHLATPRAGGERQALSVLVAARRSAVEGYTTAQRQIQALVTAAPEPLRTRFRTQRTAEMVTTAARLRSHPSHDRETASTIAALKALARRCQTLQAEAADHEAAIRVVVDSWRPDLLQQMGIGPIVAAAILCAWSHPGRCRNEAAFANLAGVAPLPASSGLTVRHRLNRRGDRQLNRALHTIVLCRLRHDPATRAYAQQRQAQGKTPPEIRRCLKRYIARQLYRQLEQPLDPP